MRFSAFVAVLLLTMPSLAAADGEESYRTRGFDTQFRTSGGDILLLRREGDAYREAAIEPYVVALRPRSGEMVWYFQFTPRGEPRR